MEVLLDSILELDKKGKTELLMLYNPQLKEGQRMKLQHTSKFGTKVSKMTMISRLVPNYASSDKVKYLNVHLVSC